MTAKHVIMSQGLAAAPMGSDHFMPTGVRNRINHPLKGHVSRASVDLRTLYRFGMANRWKTIHPTVLLIPPCVRYLQ